MNIKEIHKTFLKSKGISTDSRTNTKNTVFFALSGENFNGNKFAIDAINKGALLAVVDDVRYLTHEKCILVDNTLKTLQELASFHRKSHKAKVIGITGSNGKTTTKELISSVLSTEFNIISTLGNFNNHIGVPLTLLKINDNTEIAIVEMGANHINEIALLCEIAKPDYGIITNIGAAHLEGFGSFDGVIAAKSELYQYLEQNNGIVIVNNDDELLVKLSKNLKKFTYGKNNANIEGEILNSFPFLEINWAAENIITNCKSSIYGNYNLYNILAAITFGKIFNVSNSNTNTAIESYIPENNRSQIITTENANKIILDAYNANPYSMKAAIFSFLNGDFKNKVIILGDMFELGNFSKDEHQKIIWHLLSANNIIVILVGKEFNKTKGHGFVSISTTIETLDFLKKNQLKDKTILIKGSRGMKMETLIEAL